MMEQDEFNLIYLHCKHIAYVREHPHRFMMTLKIGFSKETCKVLHIETT